MKKLVSVVLSLSILSSFAGTQAAYDHSLDEAENCHSMTEKWFGGAALSELEPVGDLIERYGKIRNSSVLGNVSGDLTKLAAENVVEDEKKRKSCIEEMQDRMLIKITDAVTTMTVNSTSEENNIITADVSEWIFYDYDDLENEEYLTDVSGYGVEHKIKIADEDGIYKIIEDAYSEADMSGMVSSSYEEQEEDVFEETASLSDYDGTAELSAVSYNIAAAVSYSETYISHSANGTNNTSYYNSAYRNFNSVGGDCANYVSQCLYAGGIPMGGNWYYYGSSNYGSAWTSSSAMRSYMASNHGKLVTSPSSGDIWTGSPVYYVWSGGGGHSAICVGTNSSGTPVVNCHNNDRYHVKWNYGGSGTTYYTVQIAGSSNPTGVNLGDDFYAFIINTACWKHLTNDNVNVSLRSEIPADSQKWHFVKENDGTYRIYSLLDGNCLDVDMASADSGTNVKVCPANTTGAQNWTISGDVGEYRLSASCTDCVLDIENGATEEGTNVQMYSSNDTNAQKFSIYRIDNSVPQYAYFYTNKSLYKVGEQVKFSSRSDFATKFYTSIYLGDTLVQGSDIPSDYSRSFDMAGTYSAAMSAYNPTGTCHANWVNFTVYDRKPVTPVVTTDKKSYETDETVTFSINCENISTVSHLGIDKVENGVHTHILTPDVTDQSTYQYTFTEAGEYSVYVTASNYYGYSDSEKVYFSVGTNTEEPTAEPTATPTPEPNGNHAEVRLSDAKAVPGGTVEVALDLTDNSGFANLGIVIDYDNSVMTLTSVQGNANVGAIYTPAKSYELCPYNMSWNAVNNVTYTGNLATLTFAVKDNAADGVYPITLSCYKGNNGDYIDGTDVNYDEDFKSINLKYTDGTVTVASYVPGDINGDGRVTNIDGTIMLRHLAGWDVEVSEQALDVNGDGKVSNLDGTILLRHLAGWDVEIR